MTTAIKATIKLGVMFTAALGLTSCSVKPDNAAPEPEPTATESAEDQLTEPKSIIRPDAEFNREAAPLEPLSLRIPSDGDNSQLSKPAIELLSEVVSSRQMKAGGAIVLRGHTDTAGNDEVNLRVSQQRAELVRDWLIEQKVTESRITVIALGEQNPARPNANPDGTPNEENRAFNRRVMLDIAVPAALAERNSDEVPTLAEKVTAED